VVFKEVGGGYSEKSGSELRLPRCLKREGGVTVP
jgi:hypothetical protein